MSTKYTIYSTASGDIKRNLTTIASNVAANVAEDESYVEGEYPSDKFRIVDGSPVAVDPEPPPWRETRDWLLASSDYTQLPDVHFNAGVKAQWTTYRQHLRDMTGGDTWPTPPQT